MNRDYIPILGEFDGMRMKLNVVSFVNRILIVQTVELRLELLLHDNSTTSCELLISQSMTITLKLGNVADSSYTVDFIHIKLPESLNTRVYVFNCDCHFLTETGSWQTVGTSLTRLAFHLGDQVYFDELFVNVCNDMTGCCAKEYDDALIIDIVYQTLKVALLRKVNVLLGCFNVMLGDDHDICDETLRKKYTPAVANRVVKILFDCYKDVLLKLRLSDSDVVQYGNTKYLLIDNIRTMDDQTYIELLHKKVNELRILTSEHLCIMSPRVPMNNLIGCWTNAMYGKETNDTNYQSFYTDLLATNARTIKIFCGDEHIARKFTIRCAELKYEDSSVLAQMNGPTAAYGVGQGGRYCELYFVGTMNSVIDPYDSQDYVAGCIANREYNHSMHSYVVINNNQADHVLIDAKLNRYFGAMIYLWKVKL